MSYGIFNRDNNKKFNNKITAITSILENIILIFNMISTSLAVITENLKQTKISDFFYDISNVGVIVVVFLIMIFKRIVLKNSKNKN